MQTNTSQITKEEQENNRLSLLRKRLKELRDNNQQLKKDNKELKVNNQQLVNDNEQLKIDNVQLKTDNEQLKINSIQLETENKTLKKILKGISSTDFNDYSDEDQITENKNDNYYKEKYLLKFRIY